MFVTELPRMRGETRTVPLYGVIHKDKDGLIFGPARWREVQAWRRENLR